MPDLSRKAGPAKGCRAAAALALAASLLALLLPHPASAAPQAAPPPLERFGGREGLPAETINVLFFDSTGLLWLGTREGLYFYDGYAFSGYQHDVGDPSSIVDNWVRAIFEDDAGRIWVGTNSGGLACLERATGRFTSYRHNPADASSISHDSVYAIKPDGTGRFWVGTQAGLNRFDPATGESERVPLLPHGHPHSGTEWVFALVAEEDGTLWATTVGDGVLRRDAASGTVTALPIAPDDPAALPSPDTFGLTPDHEGNLWIGTRTGAVVLDRRSGTLRRIVSPPGAEWPVGDSIIPAIVAAPSGAVYVGSFDGLFRVDNPPVAAAWIGVGPDPAQPEVGKGVIALARDVSGAVWIGTAGAGLLRLPPELGIFRVLGRGSEGLSSLSHDDITAVLEDREERLWVGTFGTGVDLLAPGAERFVRLPLERGEESLAIGTLRLAEDPRGRLWIAHTAGLMRYDPLDGSIARYGHDPPDPSSLGRGYVFALLVDRDERLWVGTGGGGLFRLRPDERGFDSFPARAGDPDTPSDDFVTVLLEDRAGRLWEGTRSGGLNLIDRDTGRARRIPVDAADPGALAHHYITSILEARNGTIWIGTGGAGLAHLLSFDPVTGPRFARVTARDGLVDDNVMSIVEDDDGSLWVATRRGITRYDPERGAFINFDVADGLRSSEGNLSAAAAGRHALYIGTANGLVQIPRGTPFPDPSPARLALTGLQTLGGPVAGADSTWPPSHVEIRHGEFLTVSFAVVDYDPHRRHRYAYRIEGTDAPWHDLGARHELTFTDLAPGTHVVELRARGARGGWSDPPIALSVTVVPPFYRTTWFRVTSVLALAALAFTWHRVRTVRLERRNRELTDLQAQREAALREAHAKEEELQEAFDRLSQLTRRLEAAKEEERKRIAAELHDEMGQLLTAAKINVQLLQRLPADDLVSRRLSDTVSLLDRMIQLVRALSFDLRPPLMDELGLIASLKGHLEAQAWRSGLAVDFSAEELPPRLPTEVEIAAFRIAQEAVNNVVRHAAATRVEVRLRQSGDRLVLTVEDDGRGFERAAATPPTPSPGEHFGLVGMHERAQALGGELAVESRPGRGTTVRVALPWTT